MREGNFQRDSVCPLTRREEVCVTAAVIMRDDANEWIPATVSAFLSAAAVKRIDSAFANLVFDLNCR